MWSRTISTYKKQFDKTERGCCDDPRLKSVYKQPLEPIDFLVDGLFAQGLYILGGSPKVGKSWLALQLCLAVCTGTPFLGRKTQQGEVLYLALEDGPQRLHSRALRLTQTAPATAPNDCIPVRCV